MDVSIYTRRYCGYCSRALRLLDELQVTYKHVPVDGDPQAYQTMTERSGRTSVPQIWIGQHHVGGCDELMALHASGQLPRMLAAG